MSALTADRLIPERTGDRRNIPVAAGAKLYAGAMAAINTVGLAVPMSTALNLKGLGRVLKPADNTAGAAGDILADIRPGIYRYDNSAAADAITQADIGADCYGVDDQTVAKTSGSNTRSVAGTVFDVDDLGVWVKFF